MKSTLVISGMMTFLLCIEANNDTQKNEEKARRLKWYDRQG